MAAIRKRCATRHEAIEATREELLLFEERRREWVRANDARAAALERYQEAMRAAQEAFSCMVWRDDSEPPPNPSQEERAHAIEEARKLKEAATDLVNAATRTAAATGAYDLASLLYHHAQLATSPSGGAWDMDATTTMPLAMKNCMEDAHRLSEASRHYDRVVGWTPEADA